MDGTAVVAASAKAAFWLATSISEVAFAAFFALPVPIQGILSVGVAGLFLYEPLVLARQRAGFALERRARAYVHQDIFDRDDPNLGGTIDFVAAGQVWRPHWRPIWKTKNVWRGKVRTAKKLEKCLLEFPVASPERQLQLAKYIASLLQLAGERGTMHDFNLGAPKAVRQFLAPWFMYTVREGAGLPAANLDHSDLRVGRAVFCQVDGMISEEDWKKRTLDFKRIWGVDVVIETLKDENDQPIPGFICIRPYPDLPKEIPLEDVLDGDPEHIFIGVNAQNAKPVYVPYDKFLHACIQGITGNGKSWLIKVLLRQLLWAPGVNSITIICFKGAVDYMDMFGPEDPVTGEPVTDYVHASGKRIRIIWDMQTAHEHIKDAVKEMDVDRLPMMRAAGIDYWPDGEDWVICDEFAYIKQHQNGEALIRPWTALAQRGRAPGWRLVCCTQQSTVDAIPSQLRSCLETKWCFAVETLQIAAQMFGTCAFLPTDPTKLPIGRFQTYLHHYQEYFLLQGLRA